MNNLNLKAEKALERLARLIGVEVKYGWPRQLGLKLGIKKETIYSWLRRGVSKHGIRQIERLGYPRDQWLTEPAPYSQPPERMLPRSDGKGPAADAWRGPQGYGVPNLERHAVTRLFEPPDTWYISAVKKILKSDHHALKLALRSNIHTFHDQLEEKERIAHLEAEIEKLKKTVKDLKNVNCSSAPTGTDAEEP